MAMEPHKLRFVRCPKCYQLLVEYPSIPLYKCGCCGTVLRAKNRAPPAVQARSSESDVQNNVPSTLKKGSPQDSRSICSDEHKPASSVDQPREAAAADEIVSSPIHSTSSCKEAIEERAVSVTQNVVGSAQHRKEEETCSSTDKNAQNPRVTVKETHERGTGADSGSGLIGEIENLVATENANRGKEDKVDMSVDMRTLDEKNEVGQREERPQHAYEGVRVESHEALIEELERSLSFSSDDEYFSDEAETSGLSDALRHQMGSRRFMLGGQVNGSSRNDPHGRLIEELEMSFSDVEVEEPMEQHVVGADRVDGNKHDKQPQTLDAESANLCEEIIPSLEDGCLESGKNSQQGNRPFDNGNEEKEHTEDGNNSANDVHENKHDKQPQILDAESAHPCEEIIPSLDDGCLESEKNSQQGNRPFDNGNEEKGHTEDGNYSANDVHENKHDKQPQTVDAESANPCGESITSLGDGHLESEKISQQGNMSFDNGNEEKEDTEDGNNSASDVHENVHDKHPQILGPNSAQPYEEVSPPLDNGHLESKQTFPEENRPNDNDNQGKEDIEGDSRTANNAHGNEHVVVVNEVNEERFHEKKHSNDFQVANVEVVYPCEMSVSSTNDRDMREMRTVHQPNGQTADDTQENKEDSLDSDIAKKVHGNEEVAFDRTGETEENHLEDDSPSNYVHGEENVVAVAETVDKSEQDKNQESREAEFSNTRHVKSEVIFEQKDLLADSSKQKEEDDMGDGNTTNSIQEDSAAVASFSSWSNKRTQYKLSSFNKNKDEAPYKYRASQLRQGLSLDAKDFKPIQNFIESQMDGTSSSLSSGSPRQGDLVHEGSNRFNNVVRHERLKKMDELRDQLSRLSSQKGMEEKYQKRSLEYQQQSSSYDAEQHLQSADVDSVPNSSALESYYGYEKPPRYQPPNRFSPTHAYPCCDFGDAEARIPYNYDLWEFNSYYQSSYAESTVLDHDSIMSSYKEPKRVVRKHILRPLSGASPFSICSGCFNLIQMPSDMYISKAKVGKMQCGRCSKVLVLSFPAAYHAQGKISVDVLEQSNNPASSTIAKNKDATSHSAEYLRGPVSINEEYGASFRRSFSNQAGASLAATQSGNKVSDSALHRLMGYDSASQLLRHSRALDDGYDSFESMVPVSRRVSRRKNK